MSQVVSDNFSALQFVQIRNKKGKYPVCTLHLLIASS